MSFENPSEVDSINVPDNDNDEKSNYFIEISCGANDPPVKYKLDKLLGNGAFSSVYSLVSCDEMKESNDLVAKVFKDQEHFENEQKIMDIIAEKRHNHKGDTSKLREEADGTIIYKLHHYSDKFINRVAANANKKTIIYTPRGEKLQRPITQQQFKLIFEIMRELRNNKIIHRDITSDHFLSRKTSDGTEKVFLVGFSSAINVENEQIVGCSYSADRPHERFCSIRIEDNYTPHQRLDLENCLKMLYLLNMPKDIDKDTAHDYWENFENKVDTFWKGALKIVRNSLGEYIMRELCDHFSKLNSLKTESDALKNKNINGKDKTEVESDVHDEKKEL